MAQTAKEFLKTFSPNDEFGIRAELDKINITKHVEDIMIRFAKMHVKNFSKEMAGTIWTEEDEIYLKLNIV